MNKDEIKEKREKEREITSLFNEQNQVNAKKTTPTLKIGQKGASHEFDLYDANNVIGGITTSPWRNKTQKRTINTGGQDRASTELLWLTLWEGDERRVMILTDKEMADKLFRRWQGCPFPYQIEIIHCNLSEKRLGKVGVL